MLPPSTVFTLTTLSWTQTVGSSRCVHLVTHGEHSCTTTRSGSFALNWPGFVCTGAVCVHCTRSLFFVCIWDNPHQKMGGRSSHARVAVRGKGNTIC
eukprot:1152020-Pelagomonas_calceolata.AAC.6